MINIILCGGSGTRLWPISRTLMPKQFVKMFDEKSLFQLTLSRNKKVCNKSLIVSNSEQYFLALEQIEELNCKDYQFLLEPIGRNTAPAIALACMELDYDSVVLVTPSDHLIKNEQNYKVAVEKAKELAEDGFLVTFGMEPSYPETGFGYIEAKGSDVLAFYEKPDLETAKVYIQKNSISEYLWNSGIFCFKAGVFLDELKKYATDIYNASKDAFENSKNIKDIIKIDYEDMLNIPEDSIDYAVMEKSKKVKVVKSNFEWSDLGSFDALYKELPKDDNKNTINSNLIAIDSKNNLVLGNYRKIATVDIEDLIIVDTPDALLISKKGSSQKVKKVVAEIKKDTVLHNSHLTVHRPWGRYTILEQNHKYKIKRIVVKPGKKLSLQKHYHRSEHWVVVEGTALVTIGKEEKLVRVNESTYIPIGVEHRLENPGKVDVVLIEAQVGEYLEEDDIVRIKDDYERV